MVIAAIVVGIGIVMEACALMSAPLGYQDDSGFHIGPETRKDDN
jgi:hypothetical protein